MRGILFCWSAMLKSCLTLCRSERRGSGFLTTIDLNLIALDVRSVAALRTLSEAGLIGADISIAQIAAVITEEKMTEKDKIIQDLRREVDELKRQVPKSGKWKWNDDYGEYFCSECLGRALWSEETGIDIEDLPFCPNCGAKME